MRMRLRYVIGAILAALVMVPAGILYADTQDETAADPCGMLSDKRVVTCFTNPYQDDTGIYDGIGAMIDSAGKDDTIEIMMYSWRSGTEPEELAHKVVDARERGVNVRVILDEASDQTKYKPIGILRDAGVEPKICRTNNCLMVDGPNLPDGQPMNHTKLVLFDIDGKKSFVAGSANFGTSDYTDNWNDMLRIRDTKLHDYLSGWYDRVWDDDWKGWDTDGDRWGSGDPATGGGDLPEMAYLYPRESGDPIASTLGKTGECKADGDGDNDWDKRVWLGISKLTKARGESIVKQLKRLKGNDCDVRLLIGKNGVKDEYLKEIRDELGTDRVRRVCTESDGEGGLHHKMVIIDAEYSDAFHEVVVTGSDIWTKDSLTNSSELDIRIGGEDDDTDDGAVRSYISHFSTLWEKHSSTKC